MSGPKDIVERLEIAASNTMLKTDQAVMREAATAIATLQGERDAAESNMDSLNEIIDVWKARAETAEASLAEAMKALVTPLRGAELRSEEETT